MNDLSEAMDFLENVFGSRNRHLVAIEAGGAKKIIGRSFDSHDSGTATWISGHNQKSGIYFTVNELSDQFRGSKPSKGDVAKAQFLHVDIEEGDKLLAAFEPRPTCVIMSGGGYNALWRIREPSENLAAVEAVNKKLAAALGGDSCWNIDRLLRLPGTINLPDERKQARGRVPAPAYLVDDLTDWELAYSAKDFAHLPDPEAQKPRGNGQDKAAFDLTKLPKRLQNIIKLGRYEDYTSRSEAVLAAACGLVRENVADDDIVAVLLNPDYKISEHIFEQSNPAAYARRQVERAHEKAGARKSASAAKPPETCNAKTLRDKVFDAIKFIVRGYVVEGATILAGRPKIGKSWLVLDWALATARGGLCFGDVRCKEGAVLFIALEDNERRLKVRIKKILGLSNEWPEKFEYATEWPRANEGGLDAIRKWILEREDARLVVVDVLQAFRAATAGRDNLYASDYEAIKSLQAIASELHVAIIIVHHLRKAAADFDPQDKISGSLGHSGGADTFMILDGTSNGTTLYGRGRDIVEFEKSVVFNRDSCRWDVLGEAAEVKLSSERKMILECLENAVELISPIVIAQETGLKRDSVRKLLGKMVAAGEVLKFKRSQYAHPCHRDFL
jgi:AAA domain